MKIIKTELIETEVIEDVFCNKCGESCCPNQIRESNNKNGFFYGLIEQTVQGGYYSQNLSDGISYTFSLCENCLKKLFDSFKIPVEETE